MTSERMQAKRAPHHLGDDYMALDLMDGEEEHDHPDGREAGA